MTARNTWFAWLASALVVLLVLAKCDPVPGWGPDHPVNQPKPPRR